jgi:diacylglycerol diphosphate phosphatase/phosphatidate phosphatase
MKILFEILGEHTAYFTCAMFCVLILVGILIASQNIKHFKRQFFEGDIALSYYDTNGDQVPVEMLYAIILPIPVGVSLLSCRFKHYSDGLMSNLSPIKIFISWVLFFCYSILITGISTEIIKVTVSRPRPATYYLCNYLGYRDAVDSGNFTSYNSLVNIGSVGNYDNCYDQSMVSDAFSSFISGHTSMSFCSMFVTCIIIRTMLNIKNVFTIIGMLSYSPLIISAWIGITRIQDNKHHEDDVFAGAIFGLMCTLITWQSFKVIIKKLNVSRVLVNNNMYQRMESGFSNNTETVSDTYSDLFTM